jgi:hypothetical protein
MGHTPPHAFVGARRTTKMRIGRREPYSDFNMYPPPHHFEEDTEKQPNQKMGNYLPARGHGPPLRPKDTGCGADRRLRWRGDET